MVDVSDKSIGLALSGGGHRATVFALGALLYIVDSGRNKDVRTISSVSGGSLVNAFVAVLDTPYNSLKPGDFDDSVSSFAEQIAGSRAWWNTTWITYGLLFTTWVFHFLTSFLISASLLSHLGFFLVLLLWATLVGPRSGGTLWKYWGTWLYVGLLPPAIVVAASFWDILPPWVLFASLVALSVIIYFRYRIAELALDRTILNKRWNLADIPKAIEHVFCATEVHGGRHAYFARDLVYIPWVGVGLTNNLSLSAAVQASANFPGGFPFRPFIRTSRRQFIGTGGALVGKRMEQREPWLVGLTDGGVYENTGVSWFMEADKRPDRIHAFETNQDFLKGFSDKLQTRFVSQLQRMRASPDQLVIINASAPRPSDLVSTKLFFVPIIGELFQLFRLPSIQYNNTGFTQRLGLRRYFLTQTIHPGAVVSIEETPSMLRDWLTAAVDRNKYSQVYPSDLPIDPILIEKASRIHEWIEKGPEIERLQTDIPSKLATLYNELESERSTLEIFKEEAKKADPGPKPAADPTMVSSEYEKKVIEHSRLLVKQHTHDQRVFELRTEINKLESMLSELSRKRSSDWGRRVFDLISSKFVATTFAPLGKETTAQLLWHGYNTAMTNCSILLDGFPIVYPPPKYEEFLSLASGLCRSTVPEAHGLDD